MKIISINFVLLCIVSLFFSSCRKYDDCTAWPTFSSAEAVLLKGVWRIERYEVNGIDSTDYILSNPYYADIKFQDNGIDNDWAGSYMSGEFTGYYYFGSSELYIGGNDSLEKSRNPFLCSLSNTRAIIQCLRKNHFEVRFEHQRWWNSTSNNSYYFKFKNVK